MLGELSRNYESNGEPGCISSGLGDAGGKSYGMYQMASRCGVVDDYVQWLHNNGYWFGENLAEHPVGSIAFDEMWRWLAYSANRNDFAESQHNYIRDAYYKPAVAALRDAMYDVEGKHNDVMRDVVWSRAVQYGVGNIVEMFVTACNKLGYPNLSYVDAKEYDKRMIKAIYFDVCSTPEWTNGSPGLREGLYSRFNCECQDALERLEG